MDIGSAAAFKARLEAGVAELSAALLIAEKGCSADEFLRIKKPLGHLIADVLRCFMSQFMRSIRN